MGLFADLNASISANLRRHGRYLTRRNGAFDNQLADACDALARFAAPDKRDAVRRQVERMIRANAAPPARIRAR